MTDVLTRLSASLADRYRLTREIGVGGMATVYLAHDLRHDRDVAIKVLHPELAAALGAERFLAEIKTTARLQHPHILPLLDSGDADGLLFYVMPYVTGESLRSRLERETQLPVEDAVRIAREVLSALESAHKQGVVHRDIKPENVLLHEEQALVADFGIALAVSAAGGARMTQTGLSLGTPAYMAPEQAMGERVIDGRADIYALGAVLYEMLVGEAPFTGPTVQAIVARVMTEQPRPVTGQRRSVPAHVNAAVLQALEKLPADRFHSAAEFSKALVTPGFESPVAPAGKTPARSRKLIRLLRRPAWAWSVAVIAAISAFGLLAHQLTNRQERQVAHLSVELAPGMQIDPNRGNIIELNHDGSMMTFGVVIGNVTRLALRRLSSDSLTFVQGSEGVHGGPAFSPDGRWIAFNAEDKLMKAPVAGGPPIVLGTAKWGQISWIGNDALVYTYNYDTGLRRVSSEGKDSSILTRPDKKRGELGHWWPQVLPDGDHVLFTNYTTPADNSKIEVLSLKNGQRQVVLEGGYFGRYAAGHLLFVRGQTVMMAPFDLGKLRPTGPSVPIGLDVETNASSGWAAVTAAENGTLAYLRSGTNRVELVWSDIHGKESPIFDSAGRYDEAEVSPDGRRLAVVRDGDVWTVDLARRLFTRLTRSEQFESNVIWTADGREVLYQRDVPQFDVFKRSADGARPEELVLTSGVDKSPSNLSPDGKTLLYNDGSSGTDDVYAIAVNRAEQKAPERVVGGPANQQRGVFSPDGRWIAYVSNESGRYETYVTPYPVNRGPGRQQISVAGGGSPRWSPDGKAVYYSLTGRIYRVPVNLVTGEIGNAEPVLRPDGMQGYTVAPDGRFVIIRTPAGGASRSVNVILNWATTIQRSADGAK